MLPPFAEVWNDPMFKEPDARFGGQSLGQVMVAGAKSMPKITSGDVFWDAINDFTAQWSEIITGKISVDEGLKKAQEKTMSRLQ